jgi:hypothetical protein
VWLDWGLASPGRPYPRWRTLICLQQGVTQGLRRVRIRFLFRRVQYPIPMRMPASPFGALSDGVQTSLPGTYAA